PITYHQSNVAIGVHDLAIPENSEMIYTGAIGFANGYLRNSLNDYFTSNVVYVDAYGLYGNNSTGEIHKPYLQVEEGADNAPENATVFIAKGSYNESLTISTPMTLKAPVGVVKIGTSEGSNARSIQPSLSAELFMNDGESLLEEWEDESVKTISLQSFPNPFTHQTELHYTLTDDSPVVVKVYDMMGQEVQTLVEEEQLKGAHHLQWDGHNQQGKTMPPGIYIMQLNTGGETSSVRVMKQ
ncbi:MAG: T9SS type A sorting domain-containing protein, partial [Bacteroidota bacterium]